MPCNMNPMQYTEKKYDESLNSLEAVCNFILHVV